MKNTYKVIFNVNNLGLYGIIPGVQEAMQSELIRVYNLYADKTNSGVTDELNQEFDNLNPTYFKDNEGKEPYELTEYNKFMADGYQRLVVDEFNANSISPILDFYVDPDEVVFKGCLKVDHNVTIDFYLKEA